MTQKKSFILHVDSLQILDHLDDEQSGILFKTIRSYHDPNFDAKYREKMIKDHFWLKLAIMYFDNQFKRDQEKYDNIVKRNQINGQKGGRPKKSKNNPIETQVNPNNLDKDNGNDSGSDLKINFKKLLQDFNDVFGKKSKVVSDNVKSKYRKLIKLGYNYDELIECMRNCKKDQYHIDTNFKYCTLEFFSRPDKIDKFYNSSKQDPTKYVPTL